VAAFDGFKSGQHAPGVCDVRRARQVAHHLLVAHGLAAHAIRLIDSHLEVGIVLNLWPPDPASDAPADIAMAEQAWQTSGERLFLDPLFRAHYPPATVSDESAPQVQAGDLALIAQQLDFLGVNYYSRAAIGAQGYVSSVPGSDYTDMGWEVCAPALRRLLKRIHAEYRLPPIYITENGAAFPDEVSADGHIHDSRRVHYLRDHFIQTRLAMQDGVDVRGYFVWSLLDNFEWARGYGKRFGLVRVDFDTQQRTIKDSGAWYADVIRGNAVEG
jgi:beta-glucosidase